MRHSPHFIELRGKLRVVEDDVDAVGLALLDRAVHKAELFWVQTLDGVASASERDERRSVAREHGILSAVDAIHEVLDCCRYQEDHA